MKRNRMLYTLLGIGALGAFFGHGMWAVQAKDSFVKLFTGSFDHVLGVTVANGTAEAWVRGIGWFDLVVSIAILATVVGAYRQRGALYDFAYSKVAVAIYAWAAFWGFVTAFARMTAVGEFLPEFWDLVERAPNFMLPIALIYVITHHRQDNTASDVSPLAAKVGISR